MSNSQKKKLAAMKHNIALAETEAYKEDKLRDPQKYKIEDAQRKRHKQEMRRKIMPFIIMAATMNHLDYIPHLDSE